MDSWQQFSPQFNWKRPFVIDFLFAHRAPSASLSLHVHCDFTLHLTKWETDMSLFDTIRTPTEMHRACWCASQWVSWMSCQGGFCHGSLIQDTSLIKQPLWRTADQPDRPQISNHHNNHAHCLAWIWIIHQVLIKFSIPTIWCGEYIYWIWLLMFLILQILGCQILEATVLLTCNLHQFVKHEHSFLGQAAGCANTLISLRSRTAGR